MSRVMLALKVSVEEGAVKPKKNNYLRVTKYIQLTINADLRHD